MASSDVIKLPFMDIQSNWDEVLRSSQGKKFWVSCRQLGEMTKNGLLIKSPSGQVQGDNDEAFIVKDQNVISLTVSHFEANVTTTFIRPKRLLPLYEKQLLCADVSESGGLGVCSSENGKLWVWETDTGEMRCALEGHVGDVYTCRFFPSGVVVLSGGADLRLKIWSALDGSCPRTFTGHTRGINDTAIIDRGRNIISVSSDGTARLWDCGSGQCLATLTSTGCQINSCALASSNSSQLDQGIPPPTEPESDTNDKMLLLACEDGSLRLCDVRNRNVMTYSENSTPLCSCAFLTPSLVLSGAEDGTLTTLDVRNMSSALSKFQFCGSSVKTLLPLKENRCLAGYRDGSCIVWNNGSLTDSLDSLEVSKLTGPESDPVTSAKMSSGYIYTSCRDGSIRVYNVADIR